MNAFSLTFLLLSCHLSFPPTWHSQGQLIFSPALYVSVGCLFYLLQLPSIVVSVFFFIFLNFFLSSLFLAVFPISSSAQIPQVLPYFARALKRFELLVFSVMSGAHGHFGFEDFQLKRIYCMIMYT